ncbi:hypothetical protein AADZ91_17350 [Colwelliaceae bacterium 6441]
MKFFNKLSTFLAVTLVTSTFANATTDVIAVKLVKAQPISTIELLNDVQSELSQSMAQNNIAITNETMNTQRFLVSQVKTTKTNKQAGSKVAIIAE